MMRIILAMLPSLLSATTEPAEDPLRSAARQGDVAAQLKLADEFFFGRDGRPRNPALAAYWFRAAAEQGNAEAFYNLGVCLEHGWGTEQSRIRAFEAYSAAAEAGRPEARLRRAMLLFTGIPGETLSSGPLPPIAADRKTALETLRELAKSNFIPARKELAKLLLRIPEFKKEYAGEIRAHLELLAAQPEPDPEILLLLAECCRDGIGGSGDLTRMADCFEQAADLGNPEAKALYAAALEYGTGRAVDREKAFALTREAAAANNPRALVRMGDYHLLGDFVSHDPAAALTCFTKAAEQQYPIAYFKLGNAYDKGFGTEEDPVRAFDEYGKAARLGYAPAQYRFGLCFLNGRGIAPDPTGAVFWFRNAIGQGNVDAMRELGVCLITGHGIAKNQSEGLKLLQAAAAAGDSEAILLLNRR